MACLAGLRTIVVRLIYTVKVIIDSCIKVTIALVVLWIIWKTWVASSVVLVRTIPFLIGIDELFSIGNMIEKFIVLTSRFVHEDRVGCRFRLRIAITASLVTLVNWNIHERLSTASATSPRACGSSLVVLVSGRTWWNSVPRMSNCGRPLRVWSVVCVQWAEILRSKLVSFNFIFPDIRVALTHSCLVRPVLWLLLQLLLQEVVMVIPVVGLRAAWPAFIVSVFKGPFERKGALRFNCRY